MQCSSNFSLDRLAGLETVTAYVNSSLFFDRLTVPLPSLLE